MICSRNSGIVDAPGRACASRRSGKTRALLRILARMPDVARRGRLRDQKGRTPAPKNRVTGKGSEMMRKFSALLAVLLAAASVAAAPRALAADVKIGVLFPLTGNAGAAGQAAKAAVEVAAEI